MNVVVGILDSRRLTSHGGTGCMLQKVCVRGNFLSTHLAATAAFPENNPVIVRFVGIYNIIHQFYIYKPKIYV